jgi:hypothetical protein
MGGGLMQLVAYGAQDIYLTGNPQITFFKKVYKRHTNFSRESIQIKFNGDTGVGLRAQAIISRNADLLHRMYLEITYATATCRYPNAFASIDNVELHIGGQIIDKHYGEWMHLWTELITAGDKSILLNKMTECQVSGRTAIVPLQFWFCRNPGLAIPLVCLQYHEVKVIVEFAAASSAGETLTANLFCDYIYLDTEERRRFAQISHEYLIEQANRVNKSIVTSGSGAITHSAKLNINHPVKELIWVVQNNGLTDEGKFNYKRYEGSTSQTVANHEQLNTALLRLNGHDRMVERSGEYFRNVQRFEHHSGVGMKSQGTEDSGAEHTFTAVDNNLTDDSAAIYSASALAAYTHGTVLLNDATGQSAVDGTTLNVDLAEGCIIQFNSGATQTITLTKDYRLTDQALVGVGGATAIANSNTIANIQIPYINLNHILSDYDADMVHIGDKFVITPTAATYDTHISNATNASAQTITITADNYDRDTGRLTLTSTIYILAAMFDNTNSAAITVTLRNVVYGTKVVAAPSWCYMYCFSIDPEEHQPSGTCNFSRIDKADLILTLNSDEASSGANVARDVRVYGVNYNVLRIMSGMGGLAYSN